LLKIRDLDSAKDFVKFLKGLKIRGNKMKMIKKIAGIDVSYKGDKAKLGYVLYDSETLKKIEERYYIDKVDFPYIPGFFSFREGKIISKFFLSLNRFPDVIIFDGNGKLHPERFGLATFIGRIFNINTIGCAKKLLLGNYINPENKKGAYSFIYDRGEIIGVALRPEKDITPIFISEGNGIDIFTCIKLVKRFLDGKRIPFILREAHRVAKMVPEILPNSEWQMANSE